MTLFIALLRVWGHADRNTGNEDRTIVHRGTNHVHFASSKAASWKWSLTFANSGPAWDSTNWCNRMVPWSVLTDLWTRQWRMRALLNNCKGKKRWLGSVHCWAQVSAMAGWEWNRLKKCWKGKKGISNERNQSPTILFLSTHHLWLSRWLAGQVCRFLDRGRCSKKNELSQFWLKSTDLGLLIVEM